MKTGIKILLVLFCFAAAVNAQSPEEVMRKADGLYSSGDYQGAIKLYEELLHNGYRGAALYYNLGNSYYKTGETGKAILNYERTLKHSPNDEDARYNLKLARLKIVDNIKDVPRIFIVEWWDTLLTWFSVSGWGAIVVVLYILFILSLGLYLAGRSAGMRKTGYIGGLVSLPLLALGVILLLASYKYETGTDNAVLLTDTVPVKVAPGKKSSDAFILHEGVKFEVQDRVDEWAKIKLADGKIGWLPDNTFEVI